MSGQDMNQFSSHNQQNSITGRSVGARGGQMNYGNQQQFNAGDGFSLNNNYQNQQQTIERTNYITHNSNIDDVHMNYDDVVDDNHSAVASGTNFNQDNRIYIQKQQTQQLQDNKNQSRMRLSHTYFPNQLTDYAYQIITEVLNNKKVKTLYRTVIPMNKLTVREVCEFTRRFESTNVEAYELFKIRTKNEIIDFQQLGGIGTMKNITKNKHEPSKTINMVSLTKNQKWKLYDTYFPLDFEKNRSLYKIRYSLPTITDICGTNINLTTNDLIITNNKLPPMIYNPDVDQTIPMTNEQCQLLRARIVQAIDEFNIDDYGPDANIIPAFESAVGPINGQFRLTCNNQQAKDWLIGIFPMWEPLWNDARLSINCEEFSQIDINSLPNLPILSIRNKQSTINGTDAASTNASSTNASSTNVSSTNASITNAASTDSASTNAASTNVASTNVTSSKKNKNETDKGTEKLCTKMLTTIPCADETSTIELIMERLKKQNRSFNFSSNWEWKYRGKKRTFGKGNQRVFVLEYEVKMSFPEIKSLICDFDRLLFCGVQKIKFRYLSKQFRVPLQAYLKRTMKQENK